MATGDVLDELFEDPPASGEKEIGRTIRAQTPSDVSPRPILAQATPDPLAQVLLTIQQQREAEERHTQAM